MLMPLLIHSGLLNFLSALCFLPTGILDWNSNRSVPMAIMSFTLVLVNIMLGIMNVVIYPNIWKL